MKNLPVSFSAMWLLSLLMIAISALALGWLPLDTDILEWQVIQVLRGTLVGNLFAKGFIIVGIAFLFQTWLRVGQEITCLKNSQRKNALTKTSIKKWLPWTSIGIGSLLLLVTPPLLSRDVYSYFAQGKLFASGIDPTKYTVADIPGWFRDGVDPLWAQTPSPYGPIWQILARVISEISGSNATLAAYLLRLITVIGLIVSAYFVYSLSRDTDLNTTRYAIWLSILNPLVFLHFVSGAHNDSIFIAFVLAAFWIERRAKNLWLGFTLAAIVIALAIQIKPIALIALPFIGWRLVCSLKSRFFIWPISFLIVCVFIFISARLTGFDFDYLIAAVKSPTAIFSWLSAFSDLGVGITKIFELIGLNPDAELILTVCRIAGVLIAGTIIIYLALRKSVNPIWAAGASFYAVVLLGPTVHPWYLLWGLPLIALAVPKYWKDLVSRGIIILTALLLVHAMVEGTSSSADFVSGTGFITFIIAALSVLVIMIVDPVNRKFVFTSIYHESGCTYVHKEQIKGENK